MKDEKQMRTQFSHVIQPVQLRKVSPGANNENFEYFHNKDFKITKNSADEGHFDANYKPNQRLLEIVLPVSFPSNTSDPKFNAMKGSLSSISLRQINPQEQALFKDVVEKTWSDQWRIKTNVKTDLFTRNVWKQLNPINVKVNVNICPEGSPNAYHDIIGNDSPYLDDNMVQGTENALLSTSGYSMTMWAAKTKTKFNQLPPDRKNITINGSSHSPKDYLKYKMIIRILSVKYLTLRR